MGHSGPSDNCRSLLPGGGECCLRRWQYNRPGSSTIDTPGNHPTLGPVQAGKQQVTTVSNNSNKTLQQQTTAVSNDKQQQHLINSIQF